MAKIINFFDQASSSTTPTIGNIVASNLITYANDAAFEAGEAGSPVKGNLYFNTTLDLIRYYTGAAWVSIVDESSTQTTTNKSIDGLTNTITNVDGDEVIITPTGNLTSDNAQAALEEHQGDLDGHETRIGTNEGDITNLEQLTGEAGASAHTPFTGATIPDSSSTHGALQALETEVELKIDSTEKGAANGVAELDGSGKIATAQLPTSLMEYEGDWNATTNTPTLDDTDTGKTGTVYRVTVAGTVDFGAGNITFAIGDWVYNNGSVWGLSVETTLPDTDSLPEGSTNEYYTEAKVSANTSVAANTSKVSASGSIDTHSDVDTTTATPNSGEALAWDGSNFVPTVISAGSYDAPSQLENLGLSSSAFTGSLIINLEQSDGSTDPTVGSPVSIAFRSTTANSGAYTKQEYTAAESITITSGATLGYANGDDTWVYVYGIYDNTNLEMAVSSVAKDENITHNTTIMSASSDSSSLYSTTARTNCAIRLLGVVKVAPITTAGTWTTPTFISINQGDNIKRKEVREALNTTFAAAGTVLDTWYAPLNSWTLKITPGTWRLDLKILADAIASGSNQAVLAFIAISTSTTPGSGIIESFNLGSTGGNSSTEAGSTLKSLHATIFNYEATASGNLYVHIRARNAGSATALAFLRFRSELNFSGSSDKIVAERVV